MMYSPFFSSLPLPFYLMILNDIKHISNQNSEGEDEIVNRSNTRVCLTLYSISYHLHHSNLGSFQLNPSQLIVCLVFFLAGDCSVYLFPLLPVLVYFWRSSHPYAVVPMDPNTAVWKAVVATLTAGWIAKKKESYVIPLNNFLFLTARIQLPPYALGSFGQLSQWRKLHLHWPPDKSKKGLFYISC